MNPRFALVLSVPLLVAGCGDDASSNAGETDTNEPASSGAASTSGSGSSEGSSSDPGRDPDTTTDAQTASTTGDWDDDGSSGGDTPPPPSASWYPGIPYPTDDLPSGIMPTLPEPGAQPGWPYDPIAIALPELGTGDNVWVVSVDGDDGNAGNGGQGSVDAPRRSMPLGDLGPSAHLFILGARSPHGTVDFDVGEDDTWTCTGTAEAPCFIVGIDTPRIGRRIDLVGAGHVVVDGLSFTERPSDVDRRWGSFNVIDSHYITVRNVELRGDGTNSRGGSGMSISGTEFLFSYRMRIHELGSWETNATGLDVHGWRPEYGNRYLWLIDSTLFHLQADGVQCGNSNNPNPQSETSHYVYIAGNEFYENYENAVDNKNSYHVITSSNEIHDLFGTEGMAANSSAVILSNNSEGPWTGYHWAINNHVYNTGLAIRDSGSELHELNYAVGNVIHDADVAFQQWNNNEGREFWVVNNSVYGATSNYDVFQPGNGSTTVLEGNIFHGGEVDTMSQIDSTLRNNVLFGVTVLGEWNIEDGNLDQDPTYAAPANGDLTLSPSSPAIDAVVVESEVFTTFEQLYGLDIRLDPLGTSRPSGGAWDIGAYEAPR